MNESVIYLPEVDSTNLWAKHNLDKFGPIGAVYTTHQTAGRGRLGRSWLDAPHKGLYYTAVIRTDLVQPATLPLFASLAVCDALRERYRIDCQIKWPNDLLLNGKKIVGILCEVGPDGHSIVVGIGINLAQPQEYFDAAGLPHGTSLALQGVSVDMDTDPEWLAQYMTDFGFDRALYTYEAEGFAPYRERYKALCVNLGRRVTYDGGAGTAVDVDDEGRLIVRDETGDTRVFTGVGSVLSFLPIIVVLFFFLSMLEDTGYMARVAFVMDKLLRRIGLSGRSIVPMLIGFGCTVPGVMASRTLPSERDRKMTILLTPFMSCSAKLPIYSLFAAAFFPQYAGLVMVLLYFTGIAVGVLAALLLKSTVFKGEAVPFVMELPNYRLPGLKNVAQLLWEKARDFLQKAFTVIFAATIVIWFLQNFDLQLRLTADPQASILARIAGDIAPLFGPLGFADWRISTALITGFMAKESVVSSLLILFGSEVALSAALTPAQAAPLLVFCLLYTPCIAAVASVKRELGNKWAVIMVVNQCAVAWLCALLVRLAAVALF